MKTLAILILLITILRNNVWASNKETKEVAILIPGLGDRDDSWLVKSWWNKQGIKLVPFETKWRSQENYHEKNKRLLEMIDQESTKGPVILVGVSAGGSLAINAYSQRRDKVKNVVTLCSRLRVGQREGFRGFDQRTRGYEAFAVSVEEAEKWSGEVGVEEKKKILNVRTRWLDELVPPETATIDGAEVKEIPVAGHNIGILSGLTVFSEILVKGLK